MRTRSKLLGPVVYHTATKWKSATTQWKLDSVAWNTSSSGNTIRQDSFQMTDQKTPGYFRAAREGKIIPCSPMNSSKIEYLFTPGAYKADIKVSATSFYRFDLSGYWWQADNPYGVKPSVPVVDGNLASQEALARAQSDCYDALTFAAEFRKTVEGVVTLRTRALALYERFESKVRTSSRSKRYRGMESAQILSAIWLELRYMWRPLAYDMIAAREAVRRLAEGIEDPLRRAYGSRSGSNSSARAFPRDSSVKWNDTFRGGVPGMLVTSNQTVTTVSTVHASVGLQVTTRDITMFDPLVTGWELIPFSFVFDWFISIGDLLTAFSPAATGQLKYATLAYENVSTFRSSNSLSPQNGWAVLQGSSTTCVLQKVETTYSRTLSAPVPTVSFDVSLNTAKILDLVALTVALKGKSLKRLLRYF